MCTYMHINITIRVDNRGECLSDDIQHHTKAEIWLCKYWPSDHSMYTAGELVLYVTVIKEYTH